MTAIQVVFIGAVIIIGSVENRFKFISDRTYHWIQYYGPHCLSRRHRVRHYKKKKFKYFMLMSYGAQAAQELCVHSTRGLIPHRVLSHKGK